MYFNPRAPCGARRGGKTASCGELIFQPTRPLRGATGEPVAWTTKEQISTHAPLAGRDGYVTHIRHRRRHFNPRAPCGARPLCRLLPRMSQQISTHAPLAGRDRIFVFHLRFTGGYFNPRAPCGARPQAVKGVDNIADFNPRAPCGARPWLSTTVMSSETFQPTRPLRGATFAGGAR